MSSIKVGIIGGTGLNKIELFQNAKELEVDTKFGKPSDKLICGTLNGVECILLSRHDKNHSTGPSHVNYRANLLALKNAGCHVIIATTACGSLDESFKPGDMVIIDDFIDRTHRRHYTYFDNTCTEHFGGISHMPMFPAFCPALRAILIDSCESVKAEYHKTGTMLTIEGPRFSSRAESKMYQRYAQTVNMTTCPEVMLAKELGIPYAAIAIVTDYDCWREIQGETGHVDVQSVMAQFKLSIGKVTEIIVDAVAKIGAKDWTTILEANAAFVKSNKM